MTILADHEIATLCQPRPVKKFTGKFEDGDPNLPIFAEQPGPPLLVDPFDPERVQPASIDLTLGTEFISFRDLATEGITEIDLADPPKNIGHKVKLAEDEFYVLAPMEFILGVTAERICCPPHIAAKLDGKSSLARFGLLIHVTGGFVDPGFRGPLTLEIFNVFPVPIILRPGKAFCQVGFQQLSAPAANPYNGRYQDAEGVEASKYTG